MLGRIIADLRDLLRRSVLPVWLLLGPRDYLSTLLKVGTGAALAAAILIVLPPLKLPATTQFN